MYSQIVDIGTHVGRYTIKIAKQIGNGGKVIAIETYPENYEALVENIRLNKLENVYAFNVACWDKEKDIKFSLHQIRNKARSSTKINISSDKAIIVHGTTLDNILKGLE